MKKIFSLIALMLVFVLLFTACKKDDVKNTDIGQSYVGETENPEEELSIPLDEVPLKENVVTNIYALVDFFNTKSIEDLGEQYTHIFNTVKADNYIIRPLISDVDISSEKDFALIEVVPKVNEGQISHIAYYYTTGTYNYAIRVYYLTEDQYNVALTGGLHALRNGDLDVVTREKYNNFTIVNFPDNSGYAEIILNEKYFVTVSGAKIENKKFPEVIEKETLNILTFDNVQLDSLVG